MNKKLLFSILFGVLALPFFASAQITITGIIDNSVTLTLYIGGALIVILWIITGLLFLTAQGDPGKTGKAKMALMAAVAGTVLVVLATGAKNIILTALTTGQ